MPAGSAARSTIEPGGVIPGTRYRALRPLGSGNGSVMYEVEHLELGRRFVLKVLRADLALRRDLVRRARADWQALGKLNHPNIARVTDAGVTEQGLPYFVTEQLGGETLRERLARRSSVTVPEALAIARDISMALAAAHAIGVVHRNLRPEVVFLPTLGRAKLLDFGVARLHHDTSVDRPRYRAPEQALGLTLDGRSDLYGVGLVLFEMVAGRAVFRPAALVRSRRAMALRPLAEVVPGVARALSDLVAHLLAPEPDARPRSAEVVVRELCRLERRYEQRVSTTQATAHYVTARLPFLVDTASVVSELGVIVPMPSQTLVGIPWTVADEVEAPKPESLASTSPSTGFVARPAPLPAVAALEGPASSKLEALGGPSPPVARSRERKALRQSPSIALPRSLSAPRIRMGLMLVMSCSLFGGVLLAGLARRGFAGEADAPQAERSGVAGRSTSQAPAPPLASFAPSRAPCPLLPASTPPPAPSPVTAPTTVIGSTLARATRARAAAAAAATAPTPTPVAARELARPRHPSPVPARTESTRSRSARTESDRTESASAGQGRGRTLPSEMPASGL